ncbi:hypothetical protein [Moorena bouillonii]|uniref:hypothetical protein n=1 Tax=Moorena bouillonii TaxID=207920 RepID=UPI0013011724|nr:hypothetical protein [Moorena bouillonii]
MPVSFPGASGVEQASCLFHFRADKMPTPLIVIPPLSNDKNLDIPDYYDETP